MKTKAFKIILTLATIAYPICILGHFDTFIIKYILAILWAISFFISKDNKILPFAIAVLFTLSIVIKSENFSLFYPVFINIFMLYLFLNSLKSVAFITKIAQIKEKNLDENIKNYTRNLTKIWAIFFLVNGLIAFVLIFFEDKSYWAFYNGFLSYILIGLIFIIEFIFRYFYKRRKNV